MPDPAAEPTTTIPTDNEHDRIVDRLPAVRALRIALASAILVVAPIAWSPIVNLWAHYMPLVAGGGGLLCVSMCWLDRGIRRSVEAMLASSIAFGTQALTLATGLLGDTEPPIPFLTNAQVSRVMECGWPKPWLTITREWLNSPNPIDPYALHLGSYTLALGISGGCVATVLLLNRRKLTLPRVRVLHVAMTLLYFGAAFALYFRSNSFSLTHG